MNRRAFLALAAGGALGGCALRFWPDERLWNPCLPPEISDSEWLRALWRDLDPRRVWDCHVHLLGGGAGGSWINPAMDSLRHPLQVLQKKFYVNAACIEGEPEPDAAYVARLATLADGLPVGARLMLMAFDWFHDENGRRVPERSAFHTPDRYCVEVARAHPERFEWIASIHPYREDALEALAWARQHGARAVKWLPPAMGIDPGSKRCDPFYEALARTGLPLLTHAGDEMAVSGGGVEEYGNPLRLRRALDRGVRVIVAHCATLGRGTDLDAGEDAPSVHNFDLFVRLMDEPRYQGLLHGEISAITQVNRLERAIGVLIARRDWQTRLVNGSDYPLPGVMPLISIKHFARRGWLAEEDAETLAVLRRHNPVLFDFALKRRLQVDGQRFDPTVFESRRLFDPRRR